MPIWVLRMIRAVLLILALTGPASAGAWEEFERRCLMPMENFEAPIFEGMSHDPHTSRMEYDLFYSSAEKLDLIVRYQRDLLPHQEVFSCDVSRFFKEANAEHLFAEFSAGLNGLTGTGRYLVPTHPQYYVDILCHSALHSNLIREPVLRLCLWRHDAKSVWYISAMETDLES